MQLHAVDKEIYKQLAVVNEKITYRKKSKHWDVATYSCQVMNKGPHSILSFQLKFPAQIPTSSTAMNTRYKAVYKSDLDPQAGSSINLTLDFTYSSTPSGKIKKMSMLPVKIIGATSKEYDDFNKNKYSSFSLLNSTFSQYNEDQLIKARKELEWVEIKLKQFSKQK